jgi:hypothetical protein
MADRAAETTKQISHTKKMYQHLLELGSSKYIRNLYRGFIHDIFGELNADTEKEI